MATKFSTATLPATLAKVGETKLMTQATVLPGILAAHKTPSGKYGLVVVSSGSLKFKWEDTGELLDVDADHPLVIEPARLHHVEVDGPVEFKVEFYKEPVAETASA